MLWIFVVLAILASILVIYLTTYKNSIEHEKFSMSVWGPTSAMTLRSGKSFYEEAKKIPLNDRILSKLNGATIQSADIDWILPSDYRYLDYSAPHNGQLDLSTPVFIAIPDNVDQVIEICKIAKGLKIQLAIRAGNHSYIAASSCNGGILSLEKMKGVMVDKQQQTAWVEAGTRLGEVYYALINQGPFNFPGGVCPTVGLAGYILGGGEGLLQRKFGLGCDSLLDAEMVICEGDGFRIMKSVATEDPTLMKALRGGGQSAFGLVTRLKIKVYPMSKYYANFTLKWPLKDGNKWRRAPWKAFQDISVPLDPNISCYYAFYMPPQPNPITHSMVQGQYSGDKPFNMSTIHSFLAPLSTLPDTEIEVNEISPENYLQLPLFWSGVDTVENMLKQCLAYGKNFPQENFQMLTDHYGIDGKSLDDSQVDLFLDTIQEYFEKLDPDYPGWVGLKWDMNRGRISTPTLPSVSVINNLFATSQYMYYFWTGEGGGGGVSGKINKLPALEDPKTSMLAQAQIDMYKKLTPVVEGSVYVNYPLNTIKNPLVYYYGKNLDMMLSLKGKYDPSSFWYQPESHTLRPYLKQLWRKDGLCGVGLPSMEQGTSICDPNSATPVCNDDPKSPNYRKCESNGAGIDYSKREIL